MSIAAKIGCAPRSLNDWVKKAGVDSGKRAGIPSDKAGFSAGCTSMRDKGSGNLEARVWFKKADGQVLIGERFCEDDGSITVVWHTDPKSTLGVMWIEGIVNPTVCISILNRCDSFDSYS